MFYHLSSGLFDVWFSRLGRVLYRVSVTRFSNNVSLPLSRICLALIESVTSLTVGGKGTLHLAVRATPSTHSTDTFCICSAFL
uniref:Uncharacterized protein n=1 Tax=Pararge aegeria TaxID=116150 RepID=S4PRS7_9NEOP